MRFSFKKKYPRAARPQPIAILRWDQDYMDTAKGDVTLCVTVTKIVFGVDAAEEEYNRLNTIKENTNSLYFWQATRFAKGHDLHALV